MTAIIFDESDPSNGSAALAAARKPALNDENRERLFERDLRLANDLVPFRDVLLDEGTKRFGRRSAGLGAELGPGVLQLRIGERLDDGGPAASGSRPAACRPAPRARTTT
jgi:hypothetical protein